MKSKYDTTVARIAGNIASGLVSKPDLRCSGLADASEVAEWGRSIVLMSVYLARAIVAQVERTDPAKVRRESSCAQDEGP